MKLRWTLAASLVFLCMSLDPPLPSLADSMDKAAIETEKQKMEMEERGKFQLSFFRWTGDYNDPMTFLDMWHSKNALNFGRWSNGRYDELIERSRGNADFKKREKDLIQAEKILVEEAGAVPLYYEKEAFLQKTYVKNLVRHPVGAKYTLKWVRIEGKP